MPEESQRESGVARNSLGLDTDKSRLNADPFALTTLAHPAALQITTSPTPAHPPTQTQPSPAPRLPTRPLASRPRPAHPR